MKGWTALDYVGAVVGVAYVVAIVAWLLQRRKDDERRG